MMTLSAPAHAGAAAAALAQALTPAERVMARELAAAERPGLPPPGPGEILAWLRFNMPEAALRVERALYPAD